MTQPYAPILIMLALSLSLFAGCGGPADQANPAEGATVGTTSDALSLDFALWDGATRCTVEGVTSHCCPQGMAMQGIHVVDNEFRCVSIRNPESGCVVDGNDEAATQRTYPSGTIGNITMHVCPSGKYLKGIDVGNNYLTCCDYAANNTPTLFYANFSTQDNWPMHTCTNTGTDVMDGIHVGSNVLSCAR